MKADEWAVTGTRAGLYKQHISDSRMIGYRPTLKSQGMCLIWTGIPRAQLCKTRSNTDLCVAKGKGFH